MRIFLIGKGRRIWVHPREGKIPKILFHVTNPLKRFVGYREISQSINAFAVVMSTVYEITRTPAGLAAQNLQVPLLSQLRTFLVNEVSPTEDHSHTCDLSATDDDT